MGTARGNGRRDGEASPLLANGAPPVVQSPTEGGDGRDEREAVEALAGVLARCALRQPGIVGTK